jgi:hypothetical protein
LWRSRSFSRFWNQLSNWSHAPLGYGVAAHALDDALSIIAGRGYSLPDNPDELVIRENVRVDELPEFVQQHMGPIVVRGMWYPFYRLGV